MSTPTQTAVAYGPADVLEVAARVIERVGLNDEMCVLMAIEKAEVELDLGDDGVAWSVFRTHLGMEATDVFRWNDTAEDASVVTGALRACAAGLGR